MIRFEKFTLANGLRVIVHEDPSTPLACLNILYDVGARDEDPSRTGFAHLFEHLMFGGSVNIPNYDTPLQEVGGENNAFTNNDITNYYLTLPAENIETGFWLESDRMLSLAFSEKSLEVQRNVVIEEYKQRYLNQPYGDEWLILHPLAYKVHPYRWATIGKEIAHIADARMEDVKDFFSRFYHPANAILVVAGNVQFDQVKKLTEKWFGPIPAGKKTNRDLPREPLQTELRRESVSRDVPSDALHMVFHMPGRGDQAYHTVDLMSDVLGRGQSSRLYLQLVKEKQLFTDISAYVSGKIDPGLLVISGKTKQGVAIADAEKAVRTELDRLMHEPVPERELEKVKNKAESTHVFGELSVLNRAMNLAFGELLGDASMVNTEIDRIRAVNAHDLQQWAASILKPENSSILHYLRKA
jgi:predicted Zn-dependent peptidase